MTKRYLKPKRLLVIPGFLGFLVLTYLLGLVQIPILDFPGLGTILTGIVRIAALAIALIVLLIVGVSTWLILTELYEWIFPKEVD